MPSSPRVQVALPPYVMHRLRQRAEQEGRSVSNLVAYLVEHQIRSDGALSGESSEQV